MNRITVTPNNEAHWLEMRKTNLNSTDISALFGASPYCTPYELYMIKAGLIESEFQDNDRVKWGSRLEAAIAVGVAEDEGMAADPFKDYMYVPELRIGSSFDYKVFHPDYGYGLMEVKNVDGMVFRKDWIDDKEFDEAPPHIELQVQHEMLIADLDFCFIAALVGGNKPKVIFRRRDKAIGDAILERCADFWHRIETETPYDPDFLKDADVIKALHRNAKNDFIDASDDDVMGQAAALYAAKNEQAKALDKELTVLKSQIQNAYGDYRKVLLPGIEVSMPEVSESKGTFITADMVGTHIGGRKGHRRFSVKSI